jgi:hypothetical protein
MSRASYGAASTRRLEYGDDIERLAAKAASNAFATPDLLKPASGRLGHLGGFRHGGRLLGVQSLGLSDRRLAALDA